MAQTVIQVCLILALPSYYAGTPVYMYTIFPLVVFFGALGLQMKLAKKQEQTQKLR